MDMKATETPDRAKARARQQLRASNAAVPIPKAQHKRSRSFERQQLRESYR
ncbi:MAG TPA: hypothetical protein VHL57_03795 [Flavobacteriales bacterium]|jgi:hypothetical protein|nr:hypothetical protein [Flavobacteriales bacterium]